MDKMSPWQRAEAERRIEAIKLEIRDVLSNDGAIEDRRARWEQLLTESLALQELLEATDQADDSATH